MAARQDWTAAWPRVLSALLLVVALGLAGAGCGHVPDKALADAERARAAAELASRCAPEEFAAAQRMMDRANELVERKEYDEAETAAKLARELFEKARATAEARRAECLRGPAVPAASTDGLRDPGLDGAAVPDDGYELTAVHFDFNESTVAGGDRALLDRHASWMKKNPTVRVQISGHCDEQGSTEYNLALGERRAEAVKRYLVSLGVDESRLSTISYGEELPAVPGSNDQARQINRRAEFKKR